ncbi:MULTISPECIES: aspartate-alanine antiporter [Brucella/Ochrobactrum group]|uniref:Putative transport protein n=1 Tax=Ochrobactrum soli TaxID=2448455 RepID=A0A2P9HCS5_9HYPH|nr:MULTISPECIES: aspartate-alanine antiporter [Brucella]MDX4071937.1 aspartate-alanine antiporter [Brucella sp. NBRC 113783]SPL61873.1 putative transport protein [[Ochrobactrum] soli]
MQWLQSVFEQAPEIALFLSLAGGYALGKIHFGKFQLGGVAGSLLVAVVISQVGVHIDNGVKAVLFALFIYAVGFESGPQFFRSLGRQSLREIAMAAVLAISGLVTVVVLARMFGLDKGLAAGIAAGGLTQSAIIGTASSAISKLGLAADEVQRLQANVAVGYAVTYIFGSFGAILVCVNLLPKFMGRSIRDDAIKAEAELLAGIRLLGPNEQEAAPDLVGRIYQVDKAAGKTVAEIEAKTSIDNSITIERVKRANKIIGVAPDLKLETNDIILIVGRRTGVVTLGNELGSELQSSDGMDVIVAIRDVTITAPEFVGKSVTDIKQHISADLRHGIYVIGVKRADKPLPLKPDTVIAAGDVVSLYGTDQDLQRVSSSIGPVIVVSDKTDFVFHGLGIAVGLLIGLAVIRFGSIPLTLGSGGGALLSGLLFGWYRSRNMAIGNMPTAASTLLRDLGLAGFVAVVGLQSGLQAVQTIVSSGLSIFLIGVVVTILPLIITMLFGRYVLKYDNVAVFAGALSGSRSANPAFGEILDKAGNSIPTTPFAITYALANVFLTLLGPLVVAFS